MNKRIRKKKYKELWHENPPKWLRLYMFRIRNYKETAYGFEAEIKFTPTELEKLNEIFYGIEKKKAYKKNTENLVNTTRILSVRREKTEQ